MSQVVRAMFYDAKGKQEKLGKLYIQTQSKDTRLQLRYLKSKRKVLEMKLVLQLN